MKNPLRKRLPRELRSDIGKYGALFCFLVIMIGFISGFLVSDISLKTAYDNSFEQYNVEDGHFTFLRKADQKQLNRTAKEYNVTITSLFYNDKTLKDGSAIRIYPMRKKVNQACLMDGDFPKKQSEIAIDRLYAENNDIQQNDTLSIGGKEYTVCGFVALTDYSALFKNNSDMMLDASNFCVAVVTQKAFDTLGEAGRKYCYAWTENTEPESKQEANDRAEELMKAVAKKGILTDFVPRNDNQAIMYTGDDMGGDKSMMIALLYIIMVLLAFSFAVTAKSTVEQEALSIGTLLASGYTRGELLRHYLTLPMLVTLAGAVIGNILGYTVLKDMMAGLYYHSYSLTTYVTLWSAEAFLETTVIPVLVVLLVNLVVLSRQLSLPPIQFLRRELRRKKKKRAVHLPPLRFLTRFRLRIILQNWTAYATIVVGILMANILMMFGMCLRPLFLHFKTDVLQSQFASYQYVLKGTAQTQDDEYSAYTMLSPLLSVFRQGADILEIEDADYYLGFRTKTENKDAEKYLVNALEQRGDTRVEDITVYGIEPNSKYLTDLKLPKGSNEVIVSDSYQKKYDLQVGDTITLDEQYEDKQHTFRVAGVYPYAASLCVFLPIDQMRQEFDYTDDSYSGYLSNVELDDLDEEGIASVITQDDLTVLADQLNDSMGSIVWLIVAVAALLYLLVLYLLSKMIVEKNAQSISMVKILGYTDKEVSALYNRATAIVVAIALVISLPICTALMKVILVEMMLKQMNGWINFYLAPWVYPAMVIVGAVCYFIVHSLQMKKIRKIPLSTALKQ